MYLYYIKSKDFACFCDMANLIWFKDYFFLFFFFLFSLLPEPFILQKYPPGYDEQVRLDILYMLMFEHNLGTGLVVWFLFICKLFN